MDPLNQDAEGTQRGLWADNKSILNSPYIILGTGGHPTRPRLKNVSAGQATPIGGIKADSSKEPVLEAIYDSDFWTAVDNNKLLALIEQRFTGYLNQ